MIHLCIKTSVDSTKIVAKLNVMDWKTYNITLIPLIKRFGRSYYSEDYIARHWPQWKESPQQELIWLVNQAINTGQIVPLINDKITRPKPTIETLKVELEQRQLSDCYLDTLLKEHNCSSLLELVNKKAFK